MPATPSQYIKFHSTTRRVRTLELQKKISRLYMSVYDNDLACICEIRSVIDNILGGFDNVRVNQVPSAMTT
jgi:hypothetical protein